MTILLMNTEITAEINRMSCKKQQFHIFVNFCFYNTALFKIKSKKDWSLSLWPRVCTFSAVLVQLILFSLPFFFALSPICSSLIKGAWLVHLTVKWQIIKFLSCSQTHTGRSVPLQWQQLLHLALRINEEKKDQKRHRNKSLKLLNFISGT